MGNIMVNVKEMKEIETISTLNEIGMRIQMWKNEEKIFLTMMSMDRTLRARHAQLAYIHMLIQYNKISSTPTTEINNIRDYCLKHDLLMTDECLKKSMDLNIPTLCLNLKDDPNSY